MILWYRLLLLALFIFNIFLDLVDFLLHVYSILITRLIALDLWNFLWTGFTFDYSGGYGKIALLALFIIYLSYIMELLFFLFWINNILICQAPDLGHECFSYHVSNELILVEPFPKLFKSQVEVFIFHFVKSALIYSSLLFYDSI